MNDVLETLSFDDALILTAPPGWGKTYKLLAAIKETKRRVVFIFPLRALCDEVHLSSLKMGIDTLNIRTPEDLKIIEKQKYFNSFNLILSTPEMLKNSDLFIEDYLFILDEFHLFYYWGDSFRQKLLETYFEVTSSGVPIILLTATLSSELFQRVSLELEQNYKQVIHMNMGNQKLKNIPRNTFYYPRFLRNWLLDDLKYSTKLGVSLVFCKYRSEVYRMTKTLEGLGFSVLSCVGGEASEFVQNLLNSKEPDFIVATSVVSHGVNLPNIKNIYFTYAVDNIDFYIQMIGRGGRDGDHFSIHVLNRCFFRKRVLLLGLFKVIIKRLGNKVNSLLYCTHES